MQGRRFNRHNLRDRMTRLLLSKPVVPASNLRHSPFAFELDFIGLFSAKTTNPRAHVANSLPFRETTASLDAKFASSNPAIAVDLPTAVGFCMYVTRRCLESVGTFDEERYGSGYGEEVDFCMRAARAGFRHVLAADVFVRHVGEVSFGNSGNDRRTKAQAMVDQLYPEFQPRLREFLARDPLAPLRRRVDRARPPVSRLVALFRR